MQQTGYIRMIDNFITLKWHKLIKKASQDKSSYIEQLPYNIYFIITIFLNNYETVAII